VDAEDPYRYYGVERSFELVRLKRPRLGALSKPLYALAVARALRRRPRPQLCYARDPFALAAAASLGCPMVFEAHGVPRGLIGRWLHRRLFAHPAFRRLVVISGVLCDDMRRAFPELSGRDVVVAHDAAEVSAPPPADRPAQPWGVSSGRLRVGYTGHLYPGKGMEVLVPLAQRLPQVEVHVLGGTAEDVAGWRSRLNGTTNLYLHGHVPPQATAAFRQAMDILLMPTQAEVGRAGGPARRAAWISPLKLFEYMASGKPAIVSDLPVLREVVQHEVNALLVPPADPAAWASAIERLAADAALRRRLAERARADVEARYTWAARARRVLEGVR
jgi:glycosyltransferase involved in cell wall biosynthesis